MLNHVRACELNLDHPGGKHGCGSGSGDGLVVLPQSSPLTPARDGACARGHDDYTSVPKKGGGSRTPEEVKRLKFQALELQREKERLEEENMCAVCFENPKDAVLVPCGHNTCCFKCASEISMQRVKRCPVCRSNFDQVIRVYRC